MKWVWSTCTSTCEAASTTLICPHQMKLGLRVLTSNRHGKQQSRLLRESSPGESCQSKCAAQVVQSPARQCAQKLSRLLSEPCAATRNRRGLGNSVRTGNSTHGSVVLQSSHCTGQGRVWVLCYQRKIIDQELPCLRIGVLGEIVGPELFIGIESVVTLLEMLVSHGFSSPSKRHSASTGWLRERCCGSSNAAAQLQISRPASSADHSSLHHRSLLEPIWKHTASSSRQQSICRFFVNRGYLGVLAAFWKPESGRESLLRRHRKW